MSILQFALANFLGEMPYFGLLFLLLLVGVWLFRKTLRYRRASGERVDFDDELTARDNPAFGIYFAGFIVGLTLALVGTLAGLGRDWQTNLIAIGVGALLGILLMRLSILVNDRLILYRFDDQKEIIEDCNAGVAFVYVGSFIATGLMINGILTGQSDSLLLMVRDIFVYWLAGQAILVFGGWVFQRITHFDALAVIEADNTAAGLCLGAFLAAQGAIARMALAGAGSDLWRELISVLVYALLGTLLLAVGRLVADKVMLPSSALDHEVARDANTGAAAVVAATFAAIALLLAF